MAEPLVLPSFPALEAAPTQESLANGIATFRAEMDACEESAGKAALAYHLSGLLERKGDLAGAAREQLAATNLVPDFRAPLEGLIRIAFDSRSAANLDRLLARLLTVATSPEERARARLFRIFLLLGQERHADALGEAETHLAESPGSSLAATVLDIVAARANAPEARLRATELRVEYAGTTELQGLLLERLARKRQTEGDLAGAREALRAATELSPRHDVLEARERLDRQQGEHLAAARCALQTAAFLDEAGAQTVPDARAARLRAVLSLIHAGESLEARQQLQLLACSDDGEPFEVALLFVSALEQDDPSEGLSALELALTLHDWSPEERGRLHLLASVWAARQGNNAASLQHRAEATRLLPGSLTSLALSLLALTSTDTDELVRKDQPASESPPLPDSGSAQGVSEGEVAIDAASPNAEGSFSSSANHPSALRRLLGFLEELRAWRPPRSHLESGDEDEPHESESSVEAAPQRSRRMRLALESGQATRRDLSLLLTLLYVVENSPSQALEEVDHAEQQGLSQHDAAHLRLGIHRSLSGRAFPRATTQPPSSDDQNTARQLAPKDIARQAELSVLAAPPEGLTLGSQQVWLLSALRLRIGMDPSASRHGREESDRAPGDASPAGPHSDSSTLPRLDDLLAALRRTQPDPESEPTGAMAPFSWLQAVLAPPSRPAACYIPRLEFAGTGPLTEHTSAEAILSRAFALARLFLQSTDEQDAGFGGPPPPATAVLSDLAQTFPSDPLVLGACLGALRAAPAAGLDSTLRERAHLLDAVSQALGSGTTADAAKLRAAIARLCVGLDLADHDPEKRKALGVSALEQVTSLLHHPGVSELKLWLERAAGPGSSSNARNPSETPVTDPLLQLDAAFSALEGSARGESSLGAARQAAVQLAAAQSALGRLDQPRSAAAQLLRLLLALGVSTKESADALTADPHIEDELRAELALVAALLTGGQDEQLNSALELSDRSPTLGALLASATCARRVGAEIHEARALSALAHTLGSVELIAEQMALSAVPVAPRDGKERDTQEGELATSLHDLARSTAETQSPLVGAGITWGLLERLNRRVLIEGPEDDIWVARANALCLLTEQLTAQGPDPSEAAPSHEALVGRLQAAYQALTVDENERALTLFSELLPHLQDDEALLHGLRVAAARTDSANEEASASAELARRAADQRIAAELWERAGVLYQDQLEQPEQARLCFSSALERLPGSPLAFSRLYEFAQANGDLERMLELIELRLPAAQAPDQRVELFWEKARFCRSLGRPAAALSALSELLTLQPTHLRALALSAELHLLDRRLDAAATALRAIALHPETPDDQRAEPGLHAADLLEGLHRPKEALSLLSELSRRGVPEHLMIDQRARAAALAGQWDVAYECYRQIAEERDVIAERLRASQVMLAIVRDHLASSDELKDAARLVLRDSPTDESAVSIVIEENFNLEEQTRLLAPALEETRGELRQVPLDAAKIQRFCQLTQSGAQPALERVALGMGSLTGALSERQTSRLLELSLSATRTPSGPLSSSDLETVATSQQIGTFAQLARMAQSCLRDVALPNLAGLGLTAAQRVDPFLAVRDWKEAELWCTSLQVESHELFIGGVYPEGTMVLPGETPAVILGWEVARPLSDSVRARLGYLLFSHALGFGPLLQMPLAEAEAWLAAIYLLNTTQVDPTGAGSDVEEKARTIAHFLRREDAEALSELTELLREGGLTPASLIVATRAGAARMATLIHGDPSILRKLPELIPAEEEARNQLLADVIRFAASDAFLDLRRKLGLELS